MTKNSFLAFFAATSLAACGGPLDEGPLETTDDAITTAVTAVGHVQCRLSPSGTPVDLPHATINVMNSNSDFDTVTDDVMGSGYTNDDGTFRVDGWGGDAAPDPWSGPDVYVRVVFGDRKWRESLGDSERVSVIDEIYRVNVNDTARHDHNNAGSGTIDFGPIILGDDGDWSCGNFYHAMKVYEDYRSVRGGEHPPPGAIQVQRYAAPVSSGTPWADRHYIHWYTSDPSSQTRIAHEFGHTIRHHLDGEDAHFLWDAERFRYARSEGHNACSVTEPGFAFNEGWAEYWAKTGGCGSLTGDWSREGDVAVALSNLELCVGRSGMVQVLIDAGWNTIHSYPEFEQRLMATNPDCGHAFNADYYLQHNPDVMNAYANDRAGALRHWVSVGLPNEGRRASQEFDVRYYLGQHGDLRNAFGSSGYVAALKHWQQIGFPVEGRRGSRELDIQYYIYRFADLRAAFGSNYAAALQHWRTYHSSEGRRASRDFDPVFYLNNNSDLRAAFGVNNYEAALDHFIRVGFAEGRQGAPIDSVPTGDLIYIRSAANGRFVTAASSSSSLIADSTAVGAGQLFRVEDLGWGVLALRSYANNLYVAAENGGASALIANRSSVGGTWEMFVWVPLGNHDFGLRSIANNQFVTAESGGASPLIANRTAVLGWETFTWASY